MTGYLEAIMIFIVVAHVSVSGFVQSKSASFK